MSLQKSAQRALNLLDLTLLGDNDTQHDIELLASKSKNEWGRVAALCVWPQFVQLARQSVSDANIHIATVVNFPSGNGFLKDVLFETETALSFGADEIDLVFPYQALLAGDTKTGAQMIEAVKKLCQSKKLKVILETGEIPTAEDQKLACQIALENGANFLKTSTGKTTYSASLAACEIMLQAILDSGRDVGLKPSGGIRTVQEAADYLALADRMMGVDWVDRAHFRFGASSLLQDIYALLSGIEMQTDLQSSY